MKRFTSALKTALVVAPVLGFSLIAQEARAGGLIYDPADTCTTLNCGATVINGTYQIDTSSQADPFITQIFSNGNECVRLAVISQSSDLEAVLVAPDGTVWRDDDGGGSLRPLVKANTSSGVNGWYTLQISGFSGNQATSNFQLAYGRYNLGNPNCASPTVTRFSVGDGEAPKSGGALGPVPPAGPKN